MIKFMLAIGLCLTLVNCQSQSFSKSGIAHNDYIIGSYTSSPWGFSTNSYWIAGPDGIILIGTQFLPSAAIDAVETAESYTGKKVKLAIVLHANPDKFNGTQILKSRGIEVVTSNAVQQLIPAVDEKRRSWFYQRYAPDYPDRLVLPDALPPAQKTLQAAGLTLKLHHFGPAVSEAHMVVEFDRHLFVGDLVANQNHAWMELGFSDSWIDLLENLQALDPTVIHPGRGHAKGAELLSEQITYLQFVQQAVAKYFDQKIISDDKKQAIIAEITEQYPDYGNEYFLNIGIPAEYRRLFK